MAKGFLKTYKGYRIYDTYAGYVVYDSKGNHAFETKWGLPIVENMIDTLSEKEVAHGY